VLEVKPTEGHGTTIDVILVNGVLNQGDQIVVCGMQGPIVTNIRALLTPPPLHEIRVKSEYIQNKTVKAAIGVKISAPNLEHAVPGSQLLVVGPKDDLEELQDEVQGDLATILTKVDKSGKGVCVQSSSLGSLEALLKFLEDMKIPVSGINIGPVHKKDVMRAAAMLEWKTEYATILAFDVKISPDIKKLADEMGVKIFDAPIIYHLFDKFTKYLKELKDKRREETAGQAVFPCIIEMVPDKVFRARDPIVLGVKCKEGVVKIGTPLCVVRGEKKEILELGRVESMEANHVELKEAKKGDEFAIKIGAIAGNAPVYYGRHFDGSNLIYSVISRETIDVLKENYKEDMTDELWRLIMKLKPLFAVQ
jgi:translation initiation factor 5B